MADVDDPDGNADEGDGLEGGKKHYMTGGRDGQVVNTVCCLVGLSNEEFLVAYQHQGTFSVPCPSDVHFITDQQITITQNSMNFEPHGYNFMYSSSLGHP